MQATSNDYSVNSRTRKSPRSISWLQPPAGGRLQPYVVNRRREVSRVRGEGRRCARLPKGFLQAASSCRFDRAPARSFELPAPGRSPISSVAIERAEAELAKPGQAHGQTAPGKTLPEFVPEASNKGEACDKAAALGEQRSSTGTEKEPVHRTFPSAFSISRRIASDRLGASFWRDAHCSIRAINSGASRIDVTGVLPVGGRPIFFSELTSP